MTALSRDLATKRPAQVATVHTQTVETNRMPDGSFKAVRGGLTGARMFQIFLMLLLTAGFAGFLLSVLSQGG